MDAWCVAKQSQPGVRFGERWPQAPVRMSGWLWYRMPVRGSQMAAGHDANRGPEATCRPNLRAYACRVTSSFNSQRARRNTKRVSVYPGGQCLVGGVTLMSLATANLTAFVMSSADLTWNPMQNHGKRYRTSDKRRQRDSFTSYMADPGGHRCRRSHRESWKLD